MVTWTFERTLTNGTYEIINISDYGYDLFVNNVYSQSGLVENLKETIEALKEVGFKEIF